MLRLEDRTNQQLNLAKLREDLANIISTEITNSLSIALRDFRTQLISQVERIYPNNGDEILETNIHDGVVSLQFPVFDGDDPDDWIFNANQYFSLHVVADNLKITIASAHLKRFSDAYVWYQWLKTTPTTINTWEEFCSLVRARFSYERFLAGRITLNTVKQNVSLTTQKATSTEKDENQVTKVLPANQEDSLSSKDAIADSVTSLVEEIAKVPQHSGIAFQAVRTELVEEDHIPKTVPYDFQKTNGELLNLNPNDLLVHDFDSSLSAFENNQVVNHEETRSIVSSVNSNKDPLVELTPEIYLMVYPTRGIHYKSLFHTSVYELDYFYQKDVSIENYPGRMRGRIFSNAERVSLAEDLSKLLSNDMPFNPDSGGCVHDTSLRSARTIRCSIIHQALSVSSVSDGIQLYLFEPRHLTPSEEYGDIIKLILWNYSYEKLVLFGCRKKVIHAGSVYLPNVFISSKKLFGKQVLHRIGKQGVSNFVDLLDSHIQFLNEVNAQCSQIINIKYLRSGEVFVHKPRVTVADCSNCFSLEGTVNLEWQQDNDNIFSGRPYNYCRASGPTWSLYSYCMAKGFFGCERCAKPKQVTLKLLIHFNSDAPWIEIFGVFKQVFLDADVIPYNCLVDSFRKNIMGYKQLASCTIGFSNQLSGNYCFYSSYDYSRMQFDRGRQHVVFSMCSYCDRRSIQFYFAMNGSTLMHTNNGIFFWELILQYGYRLDTLFKNFLVFVFAQDHLGNMFWTISHRTGIADECCADMSNRDAGSDYELRYTEPFSTAAVGPDMINAFACEEGNPKYSSYLLRSYIEDDKEFQWCPAPVRGLAIQIVNGSGSCDFICDCTHSFCWTRSKEGRRPVDCCTMGKWILKNNDEIAHVTWLLSTPCPNCKAPIVKSGDMENTNLERGAARKHLVDYINYYKRWVASHTTLDPAGISMRTLGIYHQDYGFAQFAKYNFAPVPNRCFTSFITPFTSWLRIFNGDFGTTARWFQDNFHVPNPCTSKTPILLNLAAAVENHKGTKDEISAFLGKLIVAYYKLLGLYYARRIFDRGKGFLIQVFSYYVGYYALCFYTTTCLLVLYASSVYTEYKNSVCQLVLPPRYGVKLFIMNSSVIVLVKHGDDNDSRKNVPSAVVARKGFYTQPDFLINYENTELFIIQPYNKADLIRLWRSTWNDKKQLGCTSHKTQANQNGSSIVFIFFSDNASTQFCGVAEMVGSVDFDKIISYWQQGMFVRASGFDLGGKILFTKGGTLRIRLLDHATVIQLNFATIYDDLWSQKQNTIMSVSAIYTAVWYVTIKYGDGKELVSTTVAAAQVIMTSVSNKTADTKAAYIPREDVILHYSFFIHGINSFWTEEIFPDTSVSFRA